MNLSDLEYGGLHLLHWIISGAIPLFLIIAAITYKLIARKTIVLIYQFHAKLAQRIKGLEKRDIANLSQISKVFHEAAPVGLKKQFSLMEKDSHLLYQDRWLPDPDLYLSSGQIFSALQNSSLSLKPGARLLSIGLLGSLISLLLQNQYPPVSQIPSLALILSPLVVGLILCLILWSESVYQGHVIRNFAVELKRLLASRLPVFSDQAGLSLMIDQFMSYDRDMNASLQAFNKTAARLAESDMAEGIRRSVEQVLLDSVAPSIQSSAAVLKDLSSELTKRQEQGMQELASQFANALASDMASHLRPVNKEITQMTSLMSDVRNYIDYAMRALETVREESATLLKDAQTSLSQMADTRTEMSEEYKRASEQLERLTASTSHMADIQQNNEAGLAKSVADLAGQLDSHSASLNKLVSEATQAMQEAQASANQQQDSAQTHIADMNEHVRLLSEELGGKITELLNQVDGETSAVARHAADIGARLGALNETLAQSLNDFSRESADYVQSTLQDFDKNLAELVRRMTQATVEIRDAVDALPAALQNRPKFDA